MRPSLSIIYCKCIFAPLISWTTGLFSYRCQHQFNWPYATCQTIRAIETGGVMLWIYEYIPFPFLPKVSITLFHLLFTWTISRTTIYFRNHLPLSPSCQIQFSISLISKGNIGNMNIPGLSSDGTRSLVQYSPSPNFWPGCYPPWIAYFVWSYL